jgi:hypothetical protein
MKDIGEMKTWGIRFKKPGAPVLQFSSTPFKINGRKISGRYLFNI